MRTASRIALQSIIILLISYGISHYYHHSWSPSRSIERSAPNIEEEIQIKHHHVGGAKGEHPLSLIHQPNSTMDACTILTDCYPGDDSVYKDIPNCHVNMDLFGRYLDSSSAILNNRVVAFVSVDVRRIGGQSDNVSLNIYNVCVARDMRRRGLARRIVEETIKESIRFYKFKEERVLLGLDVDLSSDMAVHSFSLYAKMGFLRGWQPCRTIHDLDFRPFFKAHLEQSSPNEAVLSPLNLIFSNPNEYLRRELDPDSAEPGKLRPRLPNLYRVDSSAPLDHYCMFRWYKESWADIGTLLASPFQNKTTNNSA